MEVNRGAMSKISAAERTVGGRATLERVGCHWRWRRSGGKKKYTTRNLDEQPRYSGRKLEKKEEEKGIVVSSLLEKRETEINNRSGIL